MSEFLDIMKYNGTDFLFISSSLSQSFKKSVKKFVNTDTQRSEQFGLNTPDFSVDCYVALINEEENYKAKRDGILRALRKPGNSTLIHPYYGPVENVQAASWTLNENTDEVGIGRLTINFIVSNADRNLTVQTVGVTRVAASVASAKSVVASSIENEFNSDSGLLGVYEKAQEKITAIGEQFEKSLEFVEKVTDKIDKVGGEIAEFQDNASRYAAAPRDLSQAAVNIFETINANSATFIAALQAHETFFRFGADDVEFNLGTEALRASDSNRRLLNRSVNSLALISAYLEVSNIVYRTTEAIDADIARIEAQYQYLNSLGISTAETNAINKVRDEASLVIREKKANASKIVSIDVGPTSSRSLAYRLYGSTDDSGLISTLNSSDGLLLKGSVRVLQNES